MMRAGLFEGRGITIADMSGREQSDHNGARGLSRNDPARAVLDDDAIGRRHSNLSRGMQEDVGMRLAARDLRSAEHPSLEEPGHLKNVETDGEPVRRGGRCD